jgi:hypothetical protein
VTLIAGKPKIGKSFLCLDIAIGIATGGICLGEQFRWDMQIGDGTSETGADVKQYVDARAGGASLTM